MIFAQQRVLLVIITAFLVAGTILSMSRYRRAYSLATRATENLDICRGISDQIGVMRAVPAQVSLESQSTQDLALCVQRASLAAEMAQGSIASITPQASRRLADTAYLEQNNDLDIRQVTLRQLIRFLNEATARQSGLRVTSIRLQAPRTSDNSHDSIETDIWSSEVTLTHLVFSPKSPASSSFR